MAVHLNFRHVLLTATLLALSVGQAAHAAPAKKKAATTHWSADKKASESKAESDTSLSGLYVYVDEEGVPHYSLQPLDERYVLFSNAGPVMDKDIKLAVGKPEKKIGKAYFGDVMVGLYGLGNNYGTASSAVSRRLVGNPYLARYESTIIKHAVKNGVDVNLIKAVMAAESGFNSSALSPKNAMGLMQVIPSTGARYGVSANQLMVPERNIHAGVSYLRDLSRMFRGQPELVIAAYNAGEGAVYKYNRRIPPYAETQNYVRKVMQYYQVFAGQEPNTPVFTRTKARKGAKSLAAVGWDSNARRSMQRVKTTVGSNKARPITN
ncbi:MAG: mltC 2 [Burkholderiaceae bacterium]|nr:mltC 2 [Burkholderiaceae bacterium]